jgi:hypothetical protein
MGSVPSREDLSSLPMLRMLGCGIPLIGLLGTDCVSVLSQAILYDLPATVAVVAALTMGLQDGRLGTESWIDIAYLCFFVSVCG